MMMVGKGCKRVAYIRVSSVDQNEARQVEAMAGLHIDKTFIDKLSGKDTKRPQLQAALDHMREGDVLVVYSIDRLCRNTRDLQNIVADLNARGIAIEFVKENLTFTGNDDPMSKLLLNMLGGVAEFERAIIHERQMEGIAVAKANGVYKGRKHKLTPEQVEEIRARVAAGEHKADLAIEFDVTRPTLYSALKAFPNPTRATARPSPPADDDALVEGALRQSAGFASLWSGDTQGYQDADAADAALVMRLRALTGNDLARVERLMHKSALPREEWYANNEEYLKRILRAVGQ